MNKIYRLLITTTLLLLTSTIGYGQYSQGGFASQAIKINNELYSGCLLYTSGSFIGNS